MALIDRGRLMFDYLQRLGTKDTYKAKYEALEAAVDNAPAIDAVPVVHAIQRETGFDEAYCNWGDCTNCGTSNIFPSKYCNECGARMDGDPHDGSGQ